MANRKVVDKRHDFHSVVSSSISNFRSKILKKYGDNPESDKVVFFGLYHIGDYIRFLFSNKKIHVFWAGGDILNLKKSIWRHVIPRIEAKHICENEVEQLELRLMGISAEVRPVLLDSFPSIQFQPSGNPSVFLCSHPDYNEEYGVNLIEGIASVVPDVTFHAYGVKGKSKLNNVCYHGIVSNLAFNKDIANYQAGLRLNDFDGFGEVLAKSVLLGQYPISRIYYPYIDYAKDTASLISLLKDLKNKKKPNTEAREYWLSKLNKPLI